MRPLNHNWPPLTLLWSGIQTWTLLPPWLFFSDSSGPFRGYELKSSFYSISFIFNSLGAFVCFELAEISKIGNAPHLELIWVRRSFGPITDYSWRGVIINLTLVALPFIWMRSAEKNAVCHKMDIDSGYRFEVEVRFWFTGGSDQRGDDHS